MKLSPLFGGVIILFFSSILYSASAFMIVKANKNLDIKVSFFGNGWNVSHKASTIAKSYNKFLGVYHYPLLEMEIRDPATQQIVVPTMYDCDSRQFESIDFIVLMIDNEVFVNCQYHR